MAIKQVGIFCGSNEGKDPRFLEAALQLGAILGSKHITLIYGGGTRGLMGAVARTAKQHGSRIISVVPQRFAGHQILEETDETLMVDTMQDRKKLMIDRSDAFIILPGGMGTLDEFSEVFTLQLLGLSGRPVALLNTAGFFKPLISLMETMVDSGFLKSSCWDLLIIKEHPQEILQALEKAT